ncbi:MAG: glutathione S-transferase N-terminal domain-containing protein [Betaproteobacteria bacterium]|nr:glutathione S-transferase N-terminal domain-containing protein [Betaproteobacteria bacterium]
MKIYGTPTSPYVRKVRAFAAEKGVELEYVIDRPSEAESRVPELNPLGKIPVLVLDDGEAIYDSAVIVEFLEGVKPEPCLIPGNFRDRIAVRRWEALGDGIVEATVNISHKYGPMFDQEKRDAWIPRQEAKIERALSLLERSIAGREWLHGMSFTLADIAAVYPLAYLDSVLAGFDWRARHPGLPAYAQRVMARPSFQRTDTGAP